MVDVKGGWLGVAVEPGGEDIKGLRVMRVFPSGPAARAGIRKDAVLLRVEGQPLYEPEDLSRALEATESGQVVTVTLVQGPGTTVVEKNVQVRLGDTGRIALRPILTDDGDDEQRDSFEYWEDSQGFATQIPHAAVELEFQRRLSEQNERIERLLISLREEINSLL
jgi:predicted metalloprotease with PDZ domain